MKRLVFLMALLLATPLSAETIRSGKVHRAFLKASGYPQGRPGYVADHIMPLCAGGADAVVNLQWQTVADGHVKDVAEWALCRQLRTLVANFKTQWVPKP